MSDVPDVLSIADLLDAPFWLGGAGAPTGVVPWKYPCSIAGHPYILDLSKFRRTTLQIRRLGTDDSVEPGESTLNASGVWPRAQDNWFLGAGQKFMDNRFAFESVYVHSGEYPSVRTRFWKSQGINPWDEGHLTLHQEQESIADSTVNLLICICGDYLYKTDGRNLAWTLNPTTGVPTWTSVMLSNLNTITSLTTDGSRVWLACGSEGVFVTTGGTTSVTAAATPAALNAPQGLTATAGVGTTNTDNLPATGTIIYYVTAVDAFGNETNYTATAITSTGVPVELTWNPEETASSFNVYRNAGLGVYLVSNTTSPSFTDDGSVTGTYQPGGPPTAVNNTGDTAYPATFVLYAKGHLLGSTGSDLVEILASGAIAFITQQENPGFVWNAGCECPTAILVVGNAGNNAFIGAIQPDPATSGATLAPPTWATTMPPGEGVNAIAYSAGSILMGTTLGVRSGTRPDSTGSFDVNPVVEDPGNCLCVAPWLQYTYFGWSNYDPTELWISRPTVAGLGRADMSQYTTQGVPGYATDVMTSDVSGLGGGGGGGDEGGGGGGGGQDPITTQCVIFNGTPYFVTFDGTTYDLWGPDGKYVSSGWIEPGWVRYGTIEPKILVEINFQNEPMPAGASIGFAVVDESYVLTEIGTESLVGATTILEPFDAGLKVGQRFQPIITLTAGTDQATTPDMVSWVSKAVVVPKRQDELLIPLILFTEDSSYQGADQTLYFDTLAEFLFLKQTEAAGAPVTFQLGSVTEQVYIDQIMVGDPNTTMASNASGMWINSIVTVKAMTLQ